MTKATGPAPACNAPPLLDDPRPQPSAPRPSPRRPQSPPPPGRRAAPASFPRRPLPPPSLSAAEAAGAEPQRTEPRPQRAAGAEAAAGWSGEGDAVTALSLPAPGAGGTGRAGRQHAGRRGAGRLRGRGLEHLHDLGRQQPVPAHHRTGEPAPRAGRPALRPRLPARRARPPQGRPSGRCRAGLQVYGRVGRRPSLRLPSPHPATGGRPGGPESSPGCAAPAPRTPHSEDLGLRSLLLWGPRPPQEPALCSLEASGVPSICTPAPGPTCALPASSRSLVRGAGCEGRATPWLLLCLATCGRFSGSCNPRRFSANRGQGLWHGFLPGP